MYDIYVDGFRQALTFDTGIGRGDRLFREQSPDIIEKAYITAYENTASEFAMGFEQNLKQEVDQQDIVTLSLLAVRDYLTIGLFEGQNTSLRAQIPKIINTHSGVAASALAGEAALQMGINPDQPIPPMDINDINRVALQARARLKRNTPKHSRRFSVTETVAASNLGVLAVARARQQQTGRQIGKFWLSQRDAIVRDSHVAADGTTIVLDGLFVVGGSLLAFPGDWTHGAELKEFLGCRCVLIFVE